MRDGGGGLGEREVEQFRRRLRVWYGNNARVLPWRGVRDPYRIWVSEVMLQQTRVAAVILHYERFLRLFPTLAALAAAGEQEVLAAWSGLGYYRRARMLHRAAQLCVMELGGRIPESSAELRKLPGVGEYTCAAIASIGFGESIAVVDGNVERVLLRVAGRTEDPSAGGRKFLREQAARLLPEDAGNEKANAPGDHNQAMMELGATLCLPRGPLCLQCPVHGLCRTKGEHTTAPKIGQKSRTVAYLLATRVRSGLSEILLERRPEALTLMPGMLELPPLLLNQVEGLHPVLRVRHSITDTNYRVEVYEETGDGKHNLLMAVHAPGETLCWTSVERLEELPLTGLARKVLRCMNLMALPAGAVGEQRNSSIVSRRGGAQCIL